MLGQPGLHVGMVVGAVVVEHEVNVETLGHLAVDDLEKEEEFLVAVAGQAQPGDLAGGGVEGGEESGGAVALVVVGHGARPALLDGKAGLGAVQGLDLALLVDAEHHGTLGRIEVEPDHIDQLLLEARVVGQLEGPYQVRLDAPGGPDALHHGLGDPGVSRHGPTRPVRLCGRGGVEGVVDDGLDRLLRDRGLAPPALGYLADALDAVGFEAGPPRQHHSPKATAYRALFGGHYTSLWPRSSNREEIIG